MGDRNNPIKFGPEWLRNLSRERTASASANNSQNAASASGTTAASGSGTMGAGAAAGSGGATNTVAAAFNTNTPKVQLAKLRYGREEMLALYDRTSEAPQELKYIDILYQPRGKPPVALNNSFEEDMRDAMRTAPPIGGGMASGERFGIGRGMGRGINPTDVRGRARLPFVRQLSTGRGTTSWHPGNPRMPGYSGGADDEPSPPMRSWNNSNGGNAAAARSGGDQPEWTPNKMYRSKRPGANTNWRSARDEEEWRGADNNRARPPQDKWERDWGDNRPAHRRTWVGGDSQNNEDNLPEWAVENAEACGGTFDSSGAFHGYSNDDSNLPKSQESAYALTRSHTHGSFVRSKTVEEGSEEWWASEKAKKLSPKRFDASDIKFNKKSNAVVPDLSSGSKSNNNKEESPTAKMLENPDSPSAADLSEHNAGNADDNFNKKSVRFAESKTFDALMRSDINMEEASDERGNFQSVMITPNNSLRQKHQNIVQSANNNNNRQSRKPGLLQIIQNQTAQNQQQPPTDSELPKQQNSEDKIVENLVDIKLEDRTMISKLASSSDNMLPNSSASAMSSAMSTIVNSVSHMASPAMQLRMSSPIQPLQGLAMNPNSNLATPGMQANVLQTQGLQQVGMTNSALNASLGLPLRPNNTIGQAMGLPLPNVPPPVLPNQMGSAGLQPGQLPSFQPGGGLPGMTGANVNSSLFLGQNTNNASLQSTNDMQINHGNQNMYPMHGLQHSGSQAAFNASMYGNLMQQSPTANPQTANQALTEQWYYEDPKKNIQGPFSSKDMYSWYRAGFFSSSLMVRRACDAVMRPLGSYGPVVPFVQMDHMMSPFPMGSGFEPRVQGPHESLLNPQQGLGLDVMNMSDTSSMDTMQFGSVGIIRNPPFGQQQMVESLWSQPSPSPDLLWMQQAMNARNETRVNNLSVFFWDQQPSAMTSNSLLPEGLPKEMKTEDEILAQLRASQNVNAGQKMPFSNEQPPLPQGPPPAKPAEPFLPNVNMAPNLEDLQKLIQQESLKDIPLPPEHDKENFMDLQMIMMKENEKAAVESMQAQAAQNKQVASPDSKAAKQAKNEADNTPKSKESSTKTKNSKKAKEEKKDELSEAKAYDDNSKFEKRSEESSPSKSKKEEKANKKELEKEKNQWIKEGFTIVKTEKNTKDGKRKTDEVKAVEDAELKRKEEERLAAEEDKRKRQAEILRRQQELHLQQQHQQRQAAESVAKKAPWSAVSSQAAQAPTMEGLTLAEIQRLEREKKLEQIKEQQQMMQIIAQQQAAALAREQEMQANLGWAKKKSNALSPGKTLIEIQAEARKQAMAAAAAAAAAAASQVFEEQAMPAPPPNHVPWGNPYNGGFWDTQPSPMQKAPEPPKPVETKLPKKKQPQPQQPQPSVVCVPVKKEVTPAAEFECWCTTVLASWSSKIDVPTFVGFLRDIESPYEIKDYVKCYLGDTKDSNDFARQFLERRSKLLRVGMVTPSDDLCSPALAVNPRTTSGSDYQEVKSKGKKIKKNKMMKVDAARLLGFSVTAAEDRINVGDIDTV